MLLPLAWLPVLILPLAVTVGGYSAAIFHTSKNRNAFRSWLVGASGNVLFVVSGTLLAGLNPSQVPPVMMAFVAIRFLLPGALIVAMDRARDQRAG
jgi:hypothetical protein